MATTHGRTIESESDGVHVTFVKDCAHGLSADAAANRPAESKWLSASVARDLIKQGFAVESVPAPKAEFVNPEEAARAMADANGQVSFRMLGTGQVLTAHWDVAVQKILQGVAELHDPVAAAVAEKTDADGFVPVRMAASGDVLSFPAEMATGFIRKGVGELA